MKTIYDKYFQRLIRKEVIVGAVILIFIVVYILFFKPNPTVRVNWNKLVVNKSASTLSFETPDEIKGAGKRFNVNIQLDTKGYWVNAVQSYIKYDPEILELVSTDTTDSFCRFYPENNFDAKAGMIKLVCGAPYPGFKGKNKLETISFTSKAIKTTSISFTKDSKVLANDGKGTNLLTNWDTTELKIKPRI